MNDDLKTAVYCFIALGLILSGLLGYNIGYNVGLDNGQKRATIANLDCEGLEKYIMDNDYPEKQTAKYLIECMERTP